MKKYYIKIKYIFSVLISMLQGSSSKSCPCCGYFGSFNTFGNPPRYGASCSRCGSLERHRLLALSNKHFDLFNNKSVLHFSPEPIVKDIVTKVSSLYKSADIVAGAADVVLNIENIQEADGVWDVIICCHVLEHVDDRLALFEMHRVLKDGGLLIVMVPIIEGWDMTYETSISDAQEREDHFGQADHIRYYGADIRSRIAAAGFKLEHEYTAFGGDCVKYALLRGEKVFLCRKSRRF